MQMNTTQHSIDPMSVMKNVLKKHYRKITLLVLLIMFLGISASINAILLKNIIDIVST